MNFPTIVFWAGALGVIPTNVTNPRPIGACEGARNLHFSEFRRNLSRNGTSVPEPFGAALLIRQFPISRQYTISQHARPGYWHLADK